MDREFFKIFWSAVKKLSIPGSLIIPYRKSSSGNKFLLIKHRPSQCIFFPSGNLEWGENFEKAALRELYEETGIKAKRLPALPIIHHFKYRNLPIKFKSFQKVFTVKVDTTKNPKPQEEDIEWARWLKKEEVLKNLSYPELKVTFKKALEHL